MVELYITNQYQGSEISTYKVLQPNYAFKLKDMGTCSWELALSATDTNDIPVTEDEFAPKRTDYMLKASDDLGATFTNLQGGRLLDADLEGDAGKISLAGKDWLEYLDQPYPFNYSLGPEDLTDNVDKAFLGFITVSGVDTPNLIYAATQQKIINKLLTAANDLSDITYSAVYTGTGWTEVIQYFLPYLDSTTMLGHIRAIGDLKDPFGFDYWCDWDATIHFYAPRLVANPSSVVTILDLAFGDDAVVGVKWHNGGPKATRTVAENSAGLWKESVYGPSITAFREFLEIISLGESFNYGTDLTDLLNVVAKGADAAGTLDRNPQKDLTLTCLPNLLFPTSELAGFVSMVGEAISYDSLDQFMPYHRINADYFIVSQEYKTQDDSGNYVVEFGLQQIYTT